MSRTTSRTTSGIWTYVLVVTSPAIMATPVVTIVSHATRETGSSASMASSTASEIWSATLSGCPGNTDSDVNSVLDIALAPIDLRTGGPIRHASGTPKEKNEPPAPTSPIAAGILQKDA